MLAFGSSAPVTAASGSAHQHQRRLGDALVSQPLPDSYARPPRLHRAARIDG